MTMLRWRPCHHDLRKPAESYEMSEEVKRAVAEGRPRTILMKLKFKVGNGIYCQTELPDIARYCQFKFAWNRIARYCQTWKDDEDKNGINMYKQLWTTTMFIH